ncbi:MAG: hypothetical protein QMD22_10575, partial [archaeon]|nr:hypothetical protein [archaeon]
MKDAVNMGVKSWTFLNKRSTKRSYLSEVHVRLKESLDKAIMDKRTCIAIVVIAILWRVGVSMDGKITLWESLCSGIALFIMGWALLEFLIPHEFVKIQPLIHYVLKALTTTLFYPSIACSVTSTNFFINFS